MTAELKKVANDPNFAVKFAVGDPAPELARQERGKGPEFSKVYFDHTKRFVLKSAHVSRDDLRIFDGESGRLVMVSHHPGKNPYDSLDPLGTTNQGKRFEVAGGEWESVCDVTARGRFHSFRIRPKWMSRHGRQFIKVGDRVVFNVGKVGKLSTMSLREHLTLGTGDDGDWAYRCEADMMGRSVAVFNRDEQQIAQIAKTTKALILTAAFGSGSESTIDIAPGVDCSVVLTLVMAMHQVGKHFMSDAFDNYVVDPAKDAVVDSAVDASGLSGVVNMYNSASNSAFHKTGTITRSARFIYNNFFK